MRWMFVALVLATSTVAAADPPRCASSTNRPGATSDALAWRAWLGVAACAQAGVAVAPIDRVAQLAPAVADVDHQLASAIAIYDDALENAPAPERVLAAYALGMAYTNAAVRVRAAILPIGDQLRDPAASDEFITLHRAVEPLVAHDLARARAAFAHAARIADADPDALVDPVVAWSAASARALEQAVAR